MPTPHNQANLGEIAKTVIMPGDPLRAKYIAENFLEKVKLVNQVRNIYAYTGTYQGHEITVMASGMGIPSMGIYAYELYHFYEVENIIRIGSCGAYQPDLKLFDLILAEEVFSESNFALTFRHDDCHKVTADPTLNQIITETAQKNKINLIRGNTVCSDCFDVYMPEKDISALFSRIPSDFHPLSAEMESFALFYIAKILNKKAACLMSVVDSKFIQEEATIEERQTGLNTMIKLALDASLSLKN